MGGLHTIPDTLVSLIYDTALDDSRWTELLEETVTFISSLHGVGTEPDSQPVIEKLIAHFERSSRITGKLDTIETHQQAQQHLFEQLPMPSMLLNGCGDVLLFNQQAEHYFQHSSNIKLKQQALQFKSVKLQHKFKSIVNTLIDSSELTQEQTLVLKGAELTQPISMKFVRARDTFHTEGQIIVFIAGCEHWLGERDIEAFARVYELTQAETKLTAKLAQEKRLNQIADENGVSIHTIRTQLKAIFSKTNTHRQSELLKLVLTYKQAAQRELQKGEQEAYHLGAPCFHRRLSLKGHTLLGYSDVGEPQGTPVLMMHASTGSRLQQHPNYQLLLEQGIRLITPERPGFGISSVKQQWTMSEVVHSVEQLVDHLNLEKFVLAGFCGGAPYALLASQLLASRVIHTSLISPITPYQPINLMHGVKASNKLLAYLALKTPKLLTSFTSFIAQSIINEPERYFDQVYSSLGYSDVVALSEPEVTDGFITAFKEVVRQGPQAFAYELSKTSQAWSFDLADIKSPITIFHGHQDCHVSIAHARRMARELPQSNLIEFPEHGHLLIYHCWKDILCHFREVAIAGKEAEPTVF